MADALGYLRRWFEGVDAPRACARPRSGGPPVPTTGFLALLCALWICGAAGASAQPAIPVVRFTVFSSKPIKDVGFVARTGGAPQPVVFAPTARSARYEYRGAMPLRFVDLAGGGLVAEANIPAGTRDALLLFSPIEADAATKGTKGGPALRYQVAVLDDSAVRHGPGGLAIINLSGLALNGTVNGEKVTLKPGLNPTLAVGRAAKMAFTTVFKDRTYQAYAGTANLGRNERLLLILFPPFYAGSLEVQSRLLVDQPPGTATAAPGARPPAPPAKR